MTGADTGGENVVADQEKHDRESGGAPTGPWSEQWERHHGEVVRYASHLLAGDTHAAEDVAQEAAIRLWQHSEVVDADRALGGWLRTVTRNIVIDWARRRRARPTEVALAPGTDQQGSDALDDVDAALVVAATLSCLSPAHREVVMEVYVRDRPVADVATGLGIPVGTVKSRCHAALSRLRADAAEEHPRDGDIAA